MKFTYSILLFVIPFFLGAQEKGLLWKISGNPDRKTSYLFGTMHLANKEAFTHFDKASRRIDECDAFAMELLMENNEEADMQLLMELMMTDGTTLKSLFSEKHYNMLDTMIQNATGYSLSLMNTLQPIVLLGIGEIASAKQDSSLALDEYLRTYAEQKGKKVYGIETEREQLTALKTLSYKEQAEMISIQLEKEITIEGEIDEITKHYVNGDLDSMLLMNNRNPMPPRLEKALIDDRNFIMANRVDDMMKKESVFIAVGALHLPGSIGVIELLRKKGYKIEAVND